MIKDGDSLMCHCPMCGGEFTYVMSTQGARCPCRGEVSIDTKNIEDFVILRWKDGESKKMVFKIYGFMVDERIT